MAVLAVRGRVLPNDEMTTMIAFEGLESLGRSGSGSAFERFLVEGYDAHPRIVSAAYEAGVVVLAGTDSPEHHGDCAAEAVLLAAAGVPGASAVGAASWTARQFLGLPTLVEAAPADLVVFAADRRADVDELRRPDRVIIKGAVVR